MTIKDFRKLCKEHNAMDYAMVIANSRAKEEYPFTARSLRVNSDLENVEIHFSMNNKLVDYTNDYMTVEEFLKWAGSFKNYGINQLWNQDYKLILNDAKNVNAYYVTRTYLTRHGIGRLDSECTRNDISDKMEEDKTNVPNPFQNHLRYAPLDYDSLIRRIFIDSEMYNVDVNIVFTHCNEFPVKSEELNNAIQGYFESNVRIYEQFSEKESFENLKNYFLRPLDKA